ncbi:MULTISPECIES: hypothetical protein [Arthrobacter]|uniref:O-antigen ligase n=2 Tax=Arthrobacter TaxID=1663 RepID=A0ABU9KNG6_9MICC|nr:hypothetical protein [Arthrobacter sp. YJM1]MDP5227717.1 hypothetical protein [Arthrobacter sp. YJM1]
MSFHDTTVQTGRRAKATGPRILTLQFILGAVLIFEAPFPGVPGNIPGQNFAAAALVLMGLFRRPGWRISRFRSFVPYWAALIVYLVVESMINEVDWTRRAIRLVLMVALAAQLGTGRLDIRSVLWGLMTGMILNIPLFYLHLTQDQYDGYLTGFLNDKNVAGLYYALIPILLTVLVKKRNSRLLLIAIGVGATFLTGSRTALAALLLALVWVVVTKRLGPSLQLPFLLLLYFSEQFIEERFASSGLLGDRAGTDQLRGWIADASWNLVHQTPWYGGGLGQATVQVIGKTWFFHDSYLALYREGGWIALIGVAGFLLVIGLRLFGGGRALVPVAFEAGAVITLICASKLGEVFLAMPTFILLGCLFMSRNSSVLADSIRLRASSSDAPESEPRIHER